MALENLLFASLLLAVGEPLPEVSVGWGAIGLKPPAAAKCDCNGSVSDGTAGCGWC